MLSRSLSCLLLILLVTHQLAAQLTPAEAVAAMGRGINLGNTLEPPTEGAWNNGPAQEAYFDAYVAAGFTNVRVPVRWDEHTGDEPPYTIDAAWLDRVEQVVDWGLDRDLFITLNAHHEDWLKSDYDNPTLRARFDAIWTQVAQRFSDKSDKLLLEVINEPFGMTVAQVDDVNQRVLDIIRMSNPTRLVIFGGYQYSNAEELLVARIPDDPYLIGYFHSYDPFQFGLNGVGTWGSESDYQLLDQKFAKVAAWSTENGVPVYLSEFGAVLQADYNSRMRFYAAFTEAALRYGFAFAVWDDGGMFRLLDRDSGNWPEVKDILINTYADSPTDVRATTAEPVDTITPEITLSWNNRSDRGGLVVERSVGEAAFAAVATLPAGTSSYTDTDVEIGTFYRYRLSFTRADGTLVQSYPARVLLAGEQTPFGDTAIVITDTLQAENFDRGGEEVAYHDSEAENIPNEYRTDEGVDIGGNGSGGFAVGYVARGEWLEYTVLVPEAGAFAVSAALASEQGNGSLKVSASGGSSATSVSVPAAGTGSYSTFQEFSSVGVLSLAAGEQILRVDITGDQPFNIDYFVFTPAAPDSGAVVNYFDGLDTAATRFTGEPAGITYSVMDGELTVVGDGTAGPYQTFRYDLPDSLAANVTGSGNKLYIGARTTSGDPVKLRIDLVDDSNLHTTLAGRSASISGTEFQDYVYDFADGYTDGGYGGTGCPDGTNCPVNGGRIVALTFYPEPEAGMFMDTLVIDYLSFGQPLDTSTVADAGVVNYSDDLTSASDAFSGTDQGIAYSVTDGVLTIAGDGTAEAYRSFRYTVGGENGKADVIGSDNKLFIRARTLSGDSSSLRVDLIDDQNLHTSIDNNTVVIAGDEFKVYTLEYSAYQDGGYGGTGCTTDAAPCTVDGQRVTQLVFYPEAATGGFNDTIEIDYLSFGVELSTAVRNFVQLDGLSVYPNPVENRLNLRFELNARTDVRVDLYDALGRNVRRTALARQPAGTTELTLEVADLAGGTYFLQLHLDGTPSRAFQVRIN
ncbi:hypothetical protein LEM8419_01562 [Neolewinella maritima]|uniref:CBM6 domain-containing protein n=1 Tax=Neolewinella maritima TaxID=1383882 RepID=A0ABM9B011_9BACT|nr:cellulase family glycosylhydrolase [Neolewinella maritima]CAH1000409.1 hypothetical protein LEM8419_01562 [Neolewinella maritima]